MALLSLSVITLLVVYATCEPGAEVPKAPKAGELIWEENFDTLDESRWMHQISGWRGGNNEFQYYRNNRKNSWVENGELHIRPTQVVEEMSDYDMRHGWQNEPGCNVDPCTVIANPSGDCVLPMYSAKLMTQHKFTVTFGRIEIRAKMPRGDWMWPAIWMLSDNNEYGGWPASGELDILETRGNRNLRTQAGGSVGINAFGNTLHWGPRWPYNGYPHTHWEYVMPNGDLSDDYHIFELEWTPDHMTFKFDGITTGNIAPPNPGGFWQLGGFNVDPGTPNIWGNGGIMAPFDKPFFIALNVAVGGTFFDDSFVNDPPRPWNWYGGRPVTEFYEAAPVYMPTWDRTDMIVDYIRVYSV